MYKIREEVQREKYTLLIPAMLDAHFPQVKVLSLNVKNGLAACRRP